MISGEIYINLHDGPKTHQHLLITFIPQMARNPPTLAGDKKKKKKAQEHSNGERRCERTFRASVPTRLLTRSVIHVRGNKQNWLTKLNLLNNLMFNERKLKSCMHQTPLRSKPVYRSVFPPKNFVSFATTRRSRVNLLLQVCGPKWDK